jgi:hypothetical protein
VRSSKKNSVQPWFFDRAARTGGKAATLGPIPPIGSEKRFQILDTAPDARRVRLVIDVLPSVRKRAILLKMSGSAASLPV